MSAAEARILLLVARGLSTREIAHDFRVCQQTVILDSVVTRFAYTECAGVHASQGGIDLPQ